MNIFISPIQSRQYPNFQAGKVIYKEFKQIPSLTCACCGEKMIKAESRDRFFKHVSQPLNKMVKKGLFKEWFKKIPIANVLAEFCVKHPDESLSEIIWDDENFKKLNEACKKSGDLIGEVVATSHSELRSAKAVLRRMEPFRDFIKPEKKEAFDLLTTYAGQYPRKTLTEIINLDEVQKFHTELLRNNKKVNEMLNEACYTRIEKLIKKENSEADTKKIKKTMVNILHKYYRRGSETVNLNIESFLKEYLAQNNCEKVLDKVLFEVKKIRIENVHDSNRFFLNVKKKGYDDGKIVRYFIDPSIATFEHVKPKSAGGTVNINNGIILCSECNGKRSDTPYSEFIQYNPQMPYNTQKQIQQISELILQGRIAGDCKDWPIRIASTLYENSDGKINPDISSYCKKASRKFSKEVENRTAEMNEAQQKISANNKENDEIEKQIDELLKRQRNLCDELQELRESLKEKGIQNKKDKALLKEMNKLLQKK